MYKKIFLIFGSILALAPINQQAWAETQKQSDLSAIDVTPHELALTQVLSEICPPLLNTNQKRKFAQAYQLQLQAFMPGLDPNVIMEQINTQREYRHILSSIRTWTLSYPVQENKALCIEFAESSI